MATPKPAPKSPATPAAPAGEPGASKSASFSTADSSTTRPGDTLDRNERKSSKAVGELALSDLTLWQHAKMAAKQKRDKAIEALYALVAPIKALLTGKDKSADDADGDSETVEGAEGAQKHAGGEATLLIGTPLSKRTRIIIAAAAVAMIALIGVGLRFALKAPPPLAQPAVLEVHQALEEEQAAAKAKQDAERKKVEQQEVEKAKPTYVKRKPASEVAARARKNAQIVSKSDQPAEPTQPAAGGAINEQGDCNLVGNATTVGEVLRRCLRELNGQEPPGRRHRGQ